MLTLRVLEVQFKKILIWFKSLKIYFFHLQGLRKDKCIEFEYIIYEHLDYIFQLFLCIIIKATGGKEVAYDEQKKEGKDKDQEEEKLKTLI